MSIFSKGWAALALRALNWCQPQGYILYVSYGHMSKSLGVMQGDLGMYGHIRVYNVSEYWFQNLGVLFVKNGFSV